MKLIIKWQLIITCLLSATTSQRPPPLTFALLLPTTTTTALLSQRRSSSQSSSSLSTTRIQFTKIDRSGSIILQKSSSSSSSSLFFARHRHSNISKSLSLHSKKQDNNDIISIIEKDDDDNETSNNYGWLLQLGIPLWLIYISNQWSRYSISYLVNFDISNSNSFYAMNIDIGFDKVQYGILASVAFTFLYAIASLFAGYASDRTNRKTLTIISAIIWSIATLGTAMADTYNTVLIWRIIMGLACAFATPTAYTLIRDNVPSNKVATATSFYGTGVALGSGLSSLTLILDNTLGWRQALDVIAITGLTAAVISFVLLPDDNKNVIQEENDNNNNNNNGEGFNSIITDVKESFVTDRAKWIYIGSFLRFCSGLCIGVWGAPYFRMVFADRISDYSISQAAISAVGASISGLLGGTIADKLATSSNDGNNTTTNAVGRRLWVPVVGSTLAAPAWYYAMHTPDSFEISMIWLALEYFVAECWFGPTISTLQSTVGPKIGGTAQGLFTLTGALANFAPTIVGLIYGASTTASAGSQSTELSNILSFAVCFGYLSSSFCFGMAARAEDKSK